mgnify:CR=1 FL=1|tara:strand:- start:422 stop:577 length:156 start_codon:yes stop_codon:yes gene_type:complete
MKTLKTNMRKIILRTKEYQYRGYCIIFGILLIPITKKYGDKQDVKNILRIY